MTDPIHCRTEHHGDICVITFDNPPLNALALGMRESLMAEVARVQEDAEVRAIVLIGAGGTFVAGSDIRRFGTARAVSTRDSAAVIEGSRKPVVAALDGYALGGGLEHALACHYRIASEGARLGFPEVTLGLLPAGGGTVRLPRLIGVEAALDLILSGRHVTAAAARSMGLVDEVVSKITDLKAHAIAVARRLADGGDLRRLGQEAPLGESAATEATLAAARKAYAKQGKFQPAYAEAITCIARGLTVPSAEALAHEAEAFARLEHSPQSQALRYAFAAERKATRISGPAGDLRPDPVRAAAVIGAGTMGSGIAIAFANADIPVKVLETSEAALQRGMERIASDFAKRVSRGSLTAAEAARRQSLITGVMDYAALADVDAVIEAVFERVDVKQAVFAELDKVVKPGALLLTNSSAIPIDTIAAATTRPQDVAGAHFFAPAQVMKLCETVKGTASAPMTIARTAKMARDLGKVNVVVGSCDGFAANRSRAPLVSEAMILLEEGALPEEIDAVMTDFGYPMGPFAVSDLSGLDVSYDTRKRRAALYPDFRVLPVPDRMVEAGRHGQKNGKGWYRYEAGNRTPQSDPETHAIIAATVAALGNTPRKFTAEEILRRLLFASINEACRILEDGKAARASDIDVMWLHGFGFPRHRGGLMYWGDQYGAAAVHDQVAAWAQTLGPRWRPAQLLQRAAAEGQRLQEITATVA